MHALPMFEFFVPEHQTILSPVILVGPPSVQLQKPVILSFQHCANMRQGGWVLSVFKSESPIDEPPYWRVSSLIEVSLVKSHIA